MGWIEQRPEPVRFWIRWRPGDWPTPDGPRLDLARGQLSWGSSTPIAPAADDELAGLFADVVYLPATRPECHTARDHWIRAAAAKGIPLVVQLEPGEKAPEEGAATAVYDLTAALRAGDLAPLSSLPAEATAAWPLIPGFSDDPDLQQRACEILAAAGVAVVQPVVPQLTPADRRQLAEMGGDAAFDALFHGRPVSARAFARIAVRHGLSPFFERPLPAGPPSLAANRRLAGALAAAGDLWLRLDRGEARGQVLLRAARLTDRSRFDLAALYRESNLGILDWLGTDGRKLVEELIDTGSSTLLEELRREYLADAGTS